MRNTRRRGMGDSATTNLFEQNLRGFKDLLIELYRKKTLLISQRETLRFQYMSGMKAKFESVIGDIFTRMYELNDPLLVSAVSIIVQTAKSSIPMANLNGQRDESYGALPFAIGGRMRVNMLSPIKQILTEQFQDLGDPDTRPAYKMYNFEIDVARDFTGYWLIWPHNMQVMPPTREWFEAMVDQFKGGDPALKAKYDRAIELINADWPSGQLPAVMSDMKVILEKIISKTKEIVRVQHQIDENEVALAEFVGQYQEFASSGNNLSDLLMSIQYEADNANVTPPVEAPVGATVVTAVPDAALVGPDTAPVNTIVAEIPAVQVATQETNPLLYVAGVIGLMFLFKGK